MRILALLHDYLPEHVGGVEVHAHRVGRELARRGHEVTALFSERDLARPAGQLCAGELDGVRTLERVHQREYADVEETWLEPAALRAFEGLLARERPEVVHVHHLATWGPACLAAARSAGCRVVFTAHDLYPVCDDARRLRPDGTPCSGSADCVECLRRHPLAPPADGPRGRRAQGADRLAAAAVRRRAAFRAGLEHVDRWIAPSRLVAASLADAGMPERRRVLLSPGVEGPRADPPETATGRSPAGAGRPLRVGFLGGLYHAKGAHLAIDALRRLAERGVAAELCLHGVLEWFPDYVEGLRARAVGLPVAFAGRYHPDEVDPLLDALDVLAVPSLWSENAPLVVLDAFRRRVPVVVADHGGLAELVEEGRGGLRFAPGEAGALAACLERLAREPGLAAELARAAPRPPSVGEVVDRLEALYAKG